MKPIMLLISGLANYEGYCYGIIEDDTIFVALLPQVFDSASHPFILKVRLEDTKEYTPFFIGVPYRSIDIDSKIGFEDSRINIVKPGHFCQDLGIQKSSKIFDAQDYIYKNYKPNPDFESKEA